MHATSMHVSRMEVFRCFTVFVHRIGIHTFRYFTFKFLKIISLQKNVILNSISPPSPYTWVYFVITTIPRYTRPTIPISNPNGANAEAEVCLFLLKGWTYLN